MKYTLEVYNNGRIGCFINGNLVSNSKDLSTAFDFIAQHHNKNTDEEGIPFIKQNKVPSLGKLFEL